MSIGVPLIAVEVKKLVVSAPTQLGRLTTLFLTNRMKVEPNVFASKASCTNAGGTCKMVVVPKTGSSLL